MRSGDVWFPGIVHTALPPHAQPPAGTPLGVTSRARRSDCAEGYSDQKVRSPAGVVSTAFSGESGPPIGSPVALQPEGTIPLAVNRYAKGTHEPNEPPT